MVPIPTLPPNRNNHNTRLHNHSLQWLSTIKRTGQVLYNQRNTCNAYSTQMAMRKRSKHQEKSIHRKHDNKPIFSIQIKRVQKHTYHTKKNTKYTRVLYIIIKLIQEGNILINHIGIRGLADFTLPVTRHSYPLLQTRWVNMVFTSARGGRITTVHTNTTISNFVIHFYTYVQQIYKVNSTIEKILYYIHALVFI